jgi:hypothetical protein
VKIEGAGLARQFQTGCDGGLVAFAAIAGVAAGDEVLPGGESSARARDHVIERQFTGGQYNRAVLASVAVAQQDILPGKRARLVWNAAVFEQSDHRGDAHCNPGRMQKMPVLFLGHGDTLQNQHDGAPRRTHVDGLVGGVQHQHGSMQRVGVSVGSGGDRDHTRG